MFLVNHYARERGEGDVGREKGREMEGERRGGGWREREGEGDGGREKGRGM